MLVGQQLNLAVVVFHQSRTILDPIAAVIIDRLPNPTNDGAVDVAAENAVHVESSGITNDRVLVGADKADRVLNALLDRLAQRPVLQTKNAPGRIHKRVQGKQELVSKVAQKREPLDVLHHRVELVTMEDEDAAPIGCDMDRMLLNRDLAVRAEIAGQEFIMIARDVDDACPFARLPQNFLNDVVMLLRPVNPAPQGPDINQVANNVEGVEFVLLEEMEKRGCATTPGAKMDV